MPKKQIKEDYRKAGFGNEHIFRVARTENAVAFLMAARDSLRSAGAFTAADAVVRALRPAQIAMRHAQAAAAAAGYPLNEGWPDPPAVRGRSVAEGPP